MQLIVGLGNPGEQYEKTRHNVGFMIVDRIVKNLGLKWEMNKKVNALICKTGDKIFLKPQSFMNNSGQVTRAVMDYYKLLPKNLGVFMKKNSDLSEILTVIHDDLDIEFGKIKEAVGAGSAGHKGVGSIINHVKTKNFKRFRIGIRTTAAENFPAEKYVLQKFNAEELGIVNNLEINI